jgi:hypothetical protein
VRGGLWWARRWRRCEQFPEALQQFGARVAPKFLRSPMKGPQLLKQKCPAHMQRVCWSRRVRQTPGPGAPVGSARLAAARRRRCAWPRRTACRRAYRCPPAAVSSPLRPHSARRMALSVIPTACARSSCVLCCFSRALLSAAAARSLSGCSAASAPAGCALARFLAAFMVLPPSAPVFAVPSPSPSRREWEGLNGKERERKGKRLRESVPLRLEATGLHGVSVWARRDSNPQAFAGIGS